MIAADIKKMQDPDVLNNRKVLTKMVNSDKNLRNSDKKNGNFLLRDHNACTDFTVVLSKHKHI